jgi:hypothetical protein
MRLRPACLARYSAASARSIASSSGSSAVTSAAPMEIVCVICC